MDIRVMLVDRQQILREGLIALLQQERDVRVVGHTGDGSAAVMMARNSCPDVVLMDVSLPGLNGIEATRRICARDPAIKVICRSTHDEERTVLAAMDAGATGYVGKDDAYAELIHAIRTAMAGRTYVPAALVGVLVDCYRTRTFPESHSRATLTSREREMVQLLSEGYSTQQIAQRLHISSKTVASHRENLQTKLNINSVALLTRYALREGLSSLELPCHDHATGVG